MSVIWELDHIENKHIPYCGKDCIKSFVNFLENFAVNKKN